MRIQPLDPANGAWRTRLTMAAGNADLYMALGRIPVGGAGDDFISDRGGVDGWVLRPDEFNASQTWFLRVNTTAATTWTIVTGDAFVTPLGALPFTDANANLAYDIGEAVSPCVLPPGTDTIGPEGMRFYGVTIPAGTPGWSVWLGGDTREVAVRKNTVPFHISQSYYEHKQPGQMLLVPDFLGGNQEQAFLSVVGAPGTAIPLDSRIQTVSTLAFGATTAVTAVAGAPYRVFRVTVPPAALAWDAVTTAVAGNPNVAIRRDAVPSEWFNDAVSEAPGGATDSVTLVPPFLTDGTWYITVYGDAPYSFTLFNGLPAIPVIPYVGATLNPQPLRAGTKHFVVTDIASQNGTLGWALALSGHIPGTEITLRRNAVPGRWMSRSGYHSALSGPSGPVDFNTTRSLLQRPGHQADVWYVGIFLPDVALGGFTLTRTAITPTPLAWNGGTAALGPLPPRQWSFFQFDVPATATGTLLGWDVRVTGDTAGAAQMDVRRDRLPEAIGAAWGTGSSSTVWPSGAPWGSFYDWTQRSNDGTGVPRYSKTLVSAFGRPLEPGRYYAGVFNSDEVTAANGALLSRRKEVVNHRLIDDAWINRQ